MIFNLHRKSSEEGLCTLLYSKPVNRISKALLIPKAFEPFIPNTFNLHCKSFEEDFGSFFIRAFNKVFEVFSIPNIIKTHHPKVF